MNEVNLLPPNRRHWLALRRRRRVWSVALGAYAVLSAAVCGVIAGSNTGTLIPLSLEREREERRGALLKSEIKKADGRLDEVNRRLEIARAVHEIPDWRGLLALIADRAGTEVVLDGIDVRVQTTEASPIPRRRNAKAGPKQSMYVIRISGLSRSQAAVAGYVASLELAGIFSTVRLDGTQSRFSGSGDESERYINFALTCTVRDDAPAPTREGSAESEGSR